MARDKSTRERILDVALDLFVEAGYDKASLREIAEKLGLTKAALYYHFPSKADILMALHLRMHALADEPLEALGDPPYTLDRFEAFLDDAIAQIEGNEKLFLLHRNNQAAFTTLHDKGHEGSHEEMEEKIRRLLMDPSFSASDRLKMIAAFAVAFFTPMAVQMLAGTGNNESVAPALRAIVRSVLHAPACISDNGSAGSAKARGRKGRPLAFNITRPNIKGANSKGPQ